MRFKCCVLANCFVFPNNFTSNTFFSLKQCLGHVDVVTSGLSKGQTFFGGGYYQYIYIYTLHYQIQKKLDVHQTPTYIKGAWD